MNTILKQTSDLYLAAAFSAMGATLENVDKTDPRHMVFEFSPRKVSTGALANIELTTQDLDAIERNWANQILTINAVQFAEAIKRLKSVIHSK